MGWFGFYIFEYVRTASNIFFGQAINYHNFFIGSKFLSVVE